ncbi:MAG: complex I NDUFA9 subunit family protein [Mariprofundaceae bacterium]|nr:complex I NDUFA9 subunit family protein [Mariprofundaceae bacterium]
MSKRICIFGGSGFIGRSIVAQASEAGHQVTVACRHPEKARSLLLVGANSLVKVDLCDGKGIEEAVGESDIVINLVGLLYEKGRYTFKNAHVHGTQHILSACERAEVKQYLHMSALGVSEDSDSLYSQTKAEAQACVRKSTLAWTIFCPSVVYGARDQFINKFSSLLKLALIFPVFAANTRFQPVWVEDVARAFVTSIGHKEVAQQSYDLVGSKTISLIEIMKMIMKAHGYCRLLLPVPHFAAKIAAKFFSLLPFPPLTSDQLRLLQQDNVSDQGFPAVFGQAAEFEVVLDSIVKGSNVQRLQDQLDEYRKVYWQDK